MEKHAIVITGASGSGKTTVANYITEKYGIPKMITHTTRIPRKNEVDGVDYYFETSESFEKNHFIEQVEYSGNKYGSSFEGLERAYEKSQETNYPNYVLIVVDTVGAITYAKELGHTAEIWFINTTDIAQFKERLINRGDDPKQVELRVGSDEFERDMILPDELKDRAELILNDNLEDTHKTVDDLLTKLVNKNKNQEA